MTEEEREEKILYLKDTLVPDLLSSGMDATAEDFQECIVIIEELKAEVERLQRELALSRQAFTDSISLYDR